MGWSHVNRSAGAAAPDRAETESMSTAPGPLTRSSSRAASRMERQVPRARDQKGQGVPPTQVAGWLAGHTPGPA